MLLFVSGAYVFNRDASRLVVAPLTRLSSSVRTQCTECTGAHTCSQVSGIAERLFSLKLKTFADTTQLEMILQKLVQVFDTQAIKITTLYLTDRDPE